MDGLVVGALGVIAAGTALGYWLTTRGQRALGQPRLEVERRPFRLGDTVSCRLSAAIASKVEVRQVTLALVCEEVVRWTEREHRRDNQVGRLVQRQHAEAVWTQRREVPVGRELRAGEPLEAGAEFTIPAAGAPSFDADHNCIRWRVTLRIAMPGRPDYEHYRPIDVEPRRRRAAAGAA